MHIKEARFKLSRLIEDEKNLYKEIKCGNPVGFPHIFELYPGIPQYFRIECKAGYISPITINLRNLDVPKAQQDDITSLAIYGSFTDKDPSASKHQQSFINTNKIEIKDPHGRQKFNCIK